MFEDQSQRDDSVVICNRIKHLLGQGAPWDACDLFRTAISIHPDDGALLYWGALAHARAGSSQQARALLDRAENAARGDIDLTVEVISLRGRLWKDQLHRAFDLQAGAGFALRARAEYAAAYALRGDSFPGINVAALSAMLGDHASARSFAKEVLDRLDVAAGPPDCWASATAGEACLLLGRPDEALRQYKVAFADSPGDAGSVASMRRQLHMLARVLPAARDILVALPAPTVVAFIGDPLDAPGCMDSRFAAALEPAVRVALRERLARMPAPLIVFSSAACGTELMFIEEAIAFGAEVCVVLPFDAAEYVQRRVAVGGAGWSARFDAALARASRVILATDESYLGDDLLFEHATRLVEGLASLRAAQLETQVSWLAAVNTRASPPASDAFVTLSRWHRMKAGLQTIELSGLPQSAAPSEQIASAVAEAPLDSIGPACALAARPRRTPKTLLFADIAGFGRLHDAQAPLFHASFLRIVDEQLRACATPPLEANTWGDALYVVFDQASEGAEFSLRLLARMLEVDWTANGLPESSQIRIALHAGPVFCGFDPIIGRDNYFGSGVTKTARIEPITPPGAIYTSEAFAATVAAAGQDAYAFEYMGKLELAKGYGESRIYRLARR